MQLDFLMSLKTLNRLYMKYISFKSLASVTLASSVLFFVGCSSKPKGYYKSQNNQIDRFYKNTNNGEIRNSKAMHRATLRPYEVFGETYYPYVPKVGLQLRGIASWYGPNFHAKKTSNGETYNMYAMTAAHKELPMNTMVKVYNVENGKSVIVRINDRGPFVDGRIIDLSNTAAHKIDMVKKGTARVTVTVLGFNGEINNYNAPDVQVASNNKFLGQPVHVEQKVETIEKLDDVKISAQTQKAILSGAYNIQVGAFSKESGALQTKEKFEKLLNRTVVVKPITRNGKILHKVYVTGFDSYNSASAFRNDYGLDGAVIVEN